MLLVAYSSSGLSHARGLHGPPRAALEGEGERERGDVREPGRDLVLTSLVHSDGDCDRDRAVAASQMPPAPAPAAELVPATPPPEGGGKGGRAGESGDDARRGRPVTVPD